MLLNGLCQFAHSRKILHDLAFEKKTIRWVIPLDRDGYLIGGGLIETEGEKNRGKEFLAPRTSRPKDAGGIAEFLADGLTSVFGLESEPDKKLNEKQRRDRETNNAKKHEDFWRQIEEAAAKMDSQLLNAVSVFRDSFRGDWPCFLRYGIKRSSAKTQEKKKWWVCCADGTEKAMGPDAFTFQIEGVLPLLDEEIIRPHWRTVYAEEVTSKTRDASLGICLVTGQEDVPIATTHLPKIKGVPGTQSFGAAIVSFDKPSYTSYGLNQSLNAPISMQAVSAYCNGLNTLLSREDHSLTIGGSTVCFWTGHSEEATTFFARMLRRPDPLAVTDFLKAPWAGIDRNAVKPDQFYSVTLCGNAGRIAIRHWMQTTVEQARENFARWFRDLEIADIPIPETKGKKRGKRGEAQDVTIEKDAEKMPPLAMFRLACSTVRDAKDLQPEISSQLYRAALEGTAPSVFLINPILHRLTADLQRYGIKTLFNSISRFALLRLILNRNLKEGAPMIEPKVFETDDPAYNCGRLLAVLSEIQAKAHDYQLTGAGVAERYFGTASVSPASVFPLLIRLNRHHLEKIRKSSGSAWNQEGNIQEILSRITPDETGAPPQFPRHLDLQAQGRFAIGFYQQKANVEKLKDAARKAKENAGKETSHDQG
ncbi:MAG: type I-C CRISPR-associated protein Cas8c/Csd1 [Pseudomonadota bacterium]